MSSVTRESRFVTRVRAEIAAQGLTIRGLARKIDPLNVDRARRNIHRWLDEGIAPSRASRRDVADALGIEAAELEDDDEEADPLVALFRRLAETIEERDARLEARIMARVTEVAV